MHELWTVAARRKRSTGVILPVLACAVMMSGLPATAAPATKEEPPKVSHDGLELVPDTEVAMAYIKPDADFSVYDRVMILDAFVAFKKNWARDHNRSSVYKITSRDMERIKQATADLFREVFVEELETKGDYAVVDVAAPDVLLLRPAIIDMDVTAPDTKPGGRSYNFASTAGAATLYLELYDSVSSEILARVIDRRVAGTGHVMRYTNQVTNRLEARRVLAEWAGLLRDRLDELHAPAKSSP